MLVVTPNLCFDRTLRVPVFEAGSVVRPSSAVAAPGGKGVNVCRTVASLGGRADLLGLLGADDAARFRTLAQAEGLRLHTVEVPGEVRQATIVIEDDGRASVLNESGPTVGEAEAEALLAEATALLDDATVAVASGSLPPGLPHDTYGRLAELAARRGVPSVVDAARDALAAALPFGPDVVTPNLPEAEGLLGLAAAESSDDLSPVEQVRERAVAAAHALRGRGARRALVTAGRHGAALVDDAGAHWVAAPRAEVANPIGAGDALVGGLAGALAGGADWLDAVRWGVAVASAAVEHPEAGRVDPARARELAVLSGQVPA